MTLTNFNLIMHKSSRCKSSAEKNISVVTFTVCYLVRSLAETTCSYPLD